MAKFEFCDLSQSDLSAEDILDLLPLWSTQILDVRIRETEMRTHEIKLRVAATTVDEIKRWIKEYEEKSQCSYSVRSTENVSGRYVQFKRRLFCQHNTRHGRNSEVPNRKRTRNTNCPSTMNITLRAVKSIYRGKNKNKAPNPKMPCEIILIPNHNHSVNSPEALRCRKVSEDVRKNLLKHFAIGHTPGTALNSIKMDIQLNCNNSDEVLADRKFCPDYNYCYKLYSTECKRKCRSITNIDLDAKEYLTNLLETFNEKTKENSGRIVIHDYNYIICICSPLMRRVHQKVKGASEMVFIDSFGTVDQDGSRIFLLLTPSDSGGLPLGVIVTSSESAETITIGLNLFKQMMGSNIFGGNIDGPKIFLTDDSDSEQNAIKAIWKNSTCLLCAFHVLQTVWRWLVKAKNGIEKTDRQELFQQFKAILYAPTIEDFDKNYQLALNNASKYPNYYSYLECYWIRKEIWALCYRNNLLVHDNYADHYADTAMRLIKEKIFERTKAFSLVQMVDFIITKFVKYYEIRLLDAAQNRLESNLLSKPIKMPPAGFLDQIELLNDCVYVIPSEKTKDLYYFVNADVLTCTCLDNSMGKLCKHINWVCLLINSDQYTRTIDDVHIRQTFYYIATGKEAPSSLLEPLYIKHINDTGYDMEVASPVTDNNSDSDADCKAFPIVEDIEGEAMTEGRQLIDEISKSYLDILSKSPENVVLGLRSLLESTNKLKSNTTSTFVSACTTFGLEHQEQLQRHIIPLASEENIGSRKYKVLIVKQQINTNIQVEHA